MDKFTRYNATSNAYKLPGAEEKAVIKSYTEAENRRKEYYIKQKIMGGVIIMIAAFLFTISYIDGMLLIFGAVFLVFGIYVIFTKTKVFIF